MTTHRLFRMHFFDVEPVRRPFLLTLDLGFTREPAQRLPVGNLAVGMLAGGFAYPVRIFVAPSSPTLSRFVAPGRRALRLWTTPQNAHTQVCLLDVRSLFVLF